MGNYLKSSKIINIELTTRCSLRCPQCYKEIGLEKNTDFTWEQLQSLLREASSLGVRKVLFSGGEPLLYPKIKTAIKLVKDLRMELYISTGGTKNLGIYDVLKKIDALYVSLNGSTKEINMKSRDGFELAFYTLRQAREKGVKTRINWVARNDNVYDFPKLYYLANQMGVEAIDILKNKPNVSGIIESKLNYEDIVFLATFIKDADNERVKINIESCFFELRNLCGIKVKNSILRGCSAGKYSMAVDANGKMLPCTHINGGEAICIKNSLIDFWNKNAVLDRMRKNISNHKLCSKCKYYEWCTPCPLDLEEICVLKEAEKDV